MKPIVLTISVFLLFALSAQAQDFYGSTDLKTFRDGRDKEFRNKEESPLLDEDFSNFKGLNYFEVDKKFRLKAEFERTPDEKYFEMPTSSGKLRKFVKYGILKFKLNGQMFQLNAYQYDEETLKSVPGDNDLLFVPFKDLTSGKDTYAGGRYMDVRIVKNKKIILDFNLAYNPSCAYGSEFYSCPIPPKENFLQTEIKAGEKIFNYFGKKY